MIVAFGFVVMTNGAAADELILTVQFEKTPLFSEANFMPGNSVTRYIRIANNTGQNGTVLIKTTNKSDPKGMGDKMTLKITEGGIELKNMSLTQFLSGTIFPLSNLNDGSDTQYYLEISFDSTAGDAYQGAELGFDISVGLEGDGRDGGVDTTIFQSDNPGGTGGGWIPTPTPVGKVKGESVSQETGQTGGQVGGRGGFVAAAEAGLAGLISPTPTAPAVAGESTCLPPWWWFLGYVLLLLILGTAQKMEKKVSVGGIVLQIVLLIAALLWWWFEPCGTRFWVWPVLILIVFLVSLRFYLKKSSAEETPA